MCIRGYNQLHTLIYKSESYGLPLFFRQILSDVLASGYHIPVPNMFQVEHPAKLAASITKSEVDAGGILLLMST